MPLAIACLISSFKNLKGDKFLKFGPPRRAQIQLIEIKQIFKAQ